MNKRESPLQSISYTPYRPRGDRNLAYDLCWTDSQQSIQQAIVQYKIIISCIIITLYSVT